MRTLIIVANPNTESFSHKLALAYKDGAEIGHKRVELLDLYRTKLQLGFLHPETKKEYAQNQPIRVKLQAKIAAADEIVIIHPLWWGGPPAILKNFLDQIFMPGFAFKPVKKRRFLPQRLNILPKPLLTGRKVHLIITGDSQLWVNLLLALPFLVIWKMYVFKNSGLKLKTFHFLDYMRHRSELKRSKWLAKIHRLGMKSR